MQAKIFSYRLAVPVTAESLVRGISKYQPMEALRNVNSENSIGLPEEIMIMIEGYHKATEQCDCAGQWSAKASADGWTLTSPVNDEIITTFSEYAGKRIEQEFKENNGLYHTAECTVSIEIMLMLDSRS